MSESTVSGLGAFEVCATCGVVIGNPSKHAEWHGATSSTEAEIEAALRGSAM